MANPIKVYAMCGRCHGSGTYPNASTDFGGDTVPPESTIPCTNCGGTGSIVIGFLKGSIRKKLDDTLAACEEVLSKCDQILELLQQ